MLSSVNFQNNAFKFSTLQLSNLFSFYPYFSNIEADINDNKHLIFDKFLFSIQNQLRLLVASEDGYLYVYNMDGNEGGDLTLYKQHRLDGRTEEVAQTDGPHRSEPQPINPDGGNIFVNKS